MQNLSKRLKLTDLVYVSHYIWKKVHFDSKKKAISFEQSIYQKKIVGLYSIIDYK